MGWTVTVKESHKELLNKLDDWAFYDCFYAQTMNALRAVVALHNPDGYHHANVCDVCAANYPCETIQVIETALNNV